MQHVFTGNALTQTAEQRITKELLNSSQIPHNGKCFFETRSYAAYSLFHDVLRENSDVSLDSDLLVELRRLYPEQADDAAQDYFEWKHDL